MARAGSAATGGSRTKGVAALGLGRDDHMVIMNASEARDHSLVLGPDCAESRTHPVAEHFPQRTQSLKMSP